MDRRIERQITSLLDRVPGYRGYRSKEDRRDADRRVREHVASALDQQADRVERVAADLANRRKLQEIGPVDDLARGIRHVIDRIRTAPSGYGGLWSDRDVDDAALDQLRLFDEGLIAGSEELGPSITALEGALTAGTNLGVATAQGMERLRALSSRFDLRGQVVETGRPVPEDRVLAALEPAKDESPPAAFGLKEGDALSILGDNHVVSGHIDVASEDGAFRLLRLNTGSPERWLVAARDPALGVALMTATGAKETAGAGRETTIGETAYTMRMGGSGDIDAHGIGGDGGSRASSFRYLVGQNDPTARAMILDWTTDRLVLVGKEVPANDLEIFSAATSSNG
jgi:hypothetical protein